MMNLEMDMNIDENLTEQVQASDEDLTLMHAEMSYPIDIPTSRGEMMSSETDVNINEEPASGIRQGEPDPGPDLPQAYPLIIETIPDLNNPESWESSCKAVESLLGFLESGLSADSSSPENLAEQVTASYEDLVLMHSEVPCAINMAIATDEEKAAERERRLNDPRTKYRFVFQQWPRDPKGEWIKHDGPERKGKQTSNGIDIWGATLYDFCVVQRYPEQPSAITFSSGSRVAAWMNAHGEKYHDARNMLQAAEEEEDPHLIKPCDISRLIQDQETAPWFKGSWARWHETGTKGKGRIRQDWELPDNWPPESPFSPRAYPAPWPFEPFTTHPLKKTPILQSYIPPSRLPAKLIVHDPGRLLNAEGRRNTTQNAQDITRIYRLSKSTTHTARADSDEAELASQEAERIRIRKEFLKSPSSNKPMPSGILVKIDTEEPTEGLCRPPIFVVFPHLPERPQPPEAHLYLSPSASIGKGGHSYIYRAEFEVPRSLLVDEVMCPQCILADLVKILEEQDGPQGERRDPKWDFPCGRYEMKISRKSRSMMVLEDENGVRKERLARAPEKTIEKEYVGPFRAIETRVKYQDLALGPYCEHLRETSIHPLTCKVSVAAKVSIAGDAHLAREAENYQAFPRHFFEHWNGYNIVYPLHDPVPVTPVVPQYYGYYVVDRNASTRSASENREQKNQSGSNEEYLSSILLLEDCGKQIDPDTLSVDDKQECAALLYRFHDADWLHNSVARRNIVRQPGPLNKWPLERNLNETKRGGLGTDWSYRLIDFGRSCKVEDGKEGDFAILGERLILQNWLSGMQAL